MIPKRMNYWFILMNNLRNYFLSFEDADGLVFDGIDTYLGVKSKARPKYPCIEISYDKEYDVVLATASHGIVDLWIDVWIKSSDADQSVAFEMQDSIQEKILKALIVWPQYVQKTENVAILPKVDKIVSDGELYRPAMGARIYLNVKWKT